ncbi:H/ACA ribonucleoprotein complex non-core subunit NAF1 isoform X2 [Sipha flava]|uniref:H/ACA ribonucleoprotein complex non-core subunit NAF1 n=1 Tax=Sipha flava TaxID=143950 RepID=A0A8B8FQS1_9HEMI|nr:H/ACA ribonucleoprotein complex non-core subunit NAF1 isoform X2 [Sipha flava]
MDDDDDRISDSSDDGNPGHEENNDNDAKKPDNVNSIALKEDLNEKKDEPMVSTEKSSFGSHILGSKSTNIDSESPTSFAVISESFEKSRQDISSNKSVISSETNNVQETELDSKSSVVVAKRNLPSTLSLISSNYQDSSSEDSSSEDSCVSNSDNEGSIISVPFVKEENVRTKGELDISDLPPIEDLKISVDEDKCQPIGCIKSIVDTLVIVEAFLNQPALDIDSVLFVDRGQRALGRVFDVFGPVNKPFYAVRFNNSDHIKKFDINIKEPVYCAPQTEYANFVMVSQLMKMKGSDASWRHNNEPPCEYLDYSDDEAEQQAKKIRKQKKLNAKLQGNITENGDKPPNPPNRNIKNKPSGSNAVENTPQRSTTKNSNWAQKPYNPRPPNPPNLNRGPRNFPTYAQQLSSMDYNHSYRQLQPYNPWYYDPMYAPRHSYPYPPPPPPPFMTPGYDYQLQRPPNSSNNPGRYPYPDHNFR